MIVKNPIHLGDALKSVYEWWALEMLLFRYTNTIYFTYIRKSSQIGNKICVDHASNMWFDCVRYIHRMVRFWFFVGTVTSRLKVFFWFLCFGQFEFKYIWKNMTLSFFMSALVPSFRLKRCVHNYEMIQSLEIILDTRNGKSRIFNTKCVQSERQCSVVACISKHIREKSRNNINLGSNSIVCGPLINQNKLKLQHILIYTETARLRYHSWPSIKYVHSAVLLSNIDWAFVLRALKLAIMENFPDPFDCTACDIRCKRCTDYWRQQILIFARVFFAPSLFEH